MSNPGWPTIDGPLGLSEEDSVAYARRFFRFGFCLLPWLWALNCFYFWPVLLRSRSFPRLRPCNSLSFSAFCLFFFIFSRPISRISGFWQLSSLESLPLHASFLYKLSRFLFVFFLFFHISYIRLCGFWVLTSGFSWILIVAYGFAGISGSLPHLISDWVEISFFMFLVLDNSHCHMFPVASVWSP